MKPARTITALIPLFLVALLPVAAGAAKVKVKVEPGVDFSGFATYSWETAAKLPDDHPLAEGSRLDRLIRQLIDEALQKRGLRKVEDGAADLLVTYYGGVEDTLNMKTYERQVSDGFSLGNTDSAEMQSYQSGTLIVDVVERASDRVIWSGRGSERTDLVGDTPELRQMAARLVEKIMGRYPSAR